MRFPRSLSSSVRGARHPIARRCLVALTFATTVTLAACHLGVTDVPDPSTIIDPGIVQTQDGAVGLYRGSVTDFGNIFGGEPITQYANFFQRGYSFALADGFGSDQLGTELFDGTGDIFVQRAVDPALGHDITQPYSDLHTTRLNIDQAIGALRQYGKTTPPSYLGELYALKGYIYIMFAELYCSGVPFSQAVYGGDVVLGHPQSTTQMLQSAEAQFDTAITIATDSARIRGLAYVGKARALLDLGQFADAATVASVSNVPTTFTYDLGYVAGKFPNYFNISTSGGFAGGPGSLYMGNRLGGNGLDYAAAGDPDSPDPDPRVAWQPMSSPFEGGSFPIPVRYITGDAPITLASGIEARLIDAEAALQAHDVSGWASILNDLRQTASDTPIPALTADSTTTAPDTLRENVMFRERAFWLYGTGHRFGDLRRLIRQYHRAFNTVFPIGVAFPGGSEPSKLYVNVANFVPPQEEQTANPYYHGCLSRDP